MNFFVKEKRKQKFEALFCKYFSEDFDLYSKDEVIESGLFGEGEENEIFRDALEDYLAAAKTNKTLMTGFSPFKSHHAGMTEDELLVPLIAAVCK
ncbi:MAG: hypothetical protein HUJ54_11610 [Erysipelotrichaceae bacterium]|nr:hypothetical protein [Erysipelotrichaceae bacterium]